MPAISQEVMELAQEIDAYLESHPNAADSLEGIMHWWVTQKDFGVSKDNVELALEYLCQTGKATVSNQSGQAIYSRPNLSTH